MKRNGRKKDLPQAGSADAIGRLCAAALRWYRVVKAKQARDGPPDEWSARDRRSVNKTFSGLTKLIFPAGDLRKEEARLLLRLAIELRLRVRIQMHTMSPHEFPLTSFAFDDRDTGERNVVQIEV